MTIQFTIYTIYSISRVKGVSSPSSPGQAEYGAAPCAGIHLIIICAS